MSEEESWEEPRGLTGKKTPLLLLLLLLGLCLRGEDRVAILKEEVGVVGMLKE